MARNYLDPDLCGHGFETGLTKLKQPLCPMCRRAALSVTPSKTPKKTRPRATELVLDPGLLSAADDTYLDR